MLCASDKVMHACMVAQRCELLRVTQLKGSQKPARGLLLTAHATVPIHGIAGIDRAKPSI